MSPQVCGSPPCVRGRPAAGAVHHDRGRFTPVRTGKTNRASSSNSVPLGSPPCVRGRQRQPRRGADVGRFTPVRTGKTPPSTHGQRRPPVHPRAYGEDYKKERSQPTTYGSPPCVRGRLRPAGVTLANQHGSPPCVRGRRNRMPAGTHEEPVHPRAYGEDSGVSRFATAALGSPPCVRGRRFRDATPQRLIRFTPVRTGKTAAH